MIFWFWFSFCLWPGHQEYMWHYVTWANLLFSMYVLYDLFSYLTILLIFWITINLCHLILMCRFIKFMNYNICFTKKKTYNIFCIDKSSVLRMILLIELMTHSLSLHFADSVHCWEVCLLLELEICFFLLVE